MRMVRSIYSIVKGILLIYEGGPAVALSAAIIWLFFGTSCGLLVGGATDNPGINALPVILASIAGFLFIIALVKYLRKGRGRFYQVLPDGTILIALKHQAPGMVPSFTDTAHIMPLAVGVASDAYGKSAGSAMGKSACPECQQEATFLINGIKTERFSGRSKMLLGLILLILALVLNFLLGSLLWSGVAGSPAWVRIVSLIMLFFSTTCFVSLLRSLEVRHLNIPSHHVLSRFTSTDAKNFRLHEMIIQQPIRGK